MELELEARSNSITPNSSSALRTYRDTEDWAQGIVSAASLNEWYFATAATASNHSSFTLLHLHIFIVYLYYTIKKKNVKRDIQE